MPGGFSNDFVKLVVDYHQKKMQSSKNFKYPAKMGDVNKEKFKNFMRFHKIIVNHKGQPLIQQKSYYEQKRASSALIPISRAKFRKLYLNHAQNIYQRPHFVRILTRKDEKQVFQKYHIVDGKHQGFKKTKKDIKQHYHVDGIQKFVRKQMQLCRQCKTKGKYTNN